MAILYFEQFGGLKLLLNCSVNSNMIAKYFAGKNPSFYLQILKAWFQFNKSDNQNDIMASIPSRLNLTFDYNGKTPSPMGSCSIAIFFVMLILRTASR